MATRIRVEFTRDELDRLVTGCNNTEHTLYVRLWDAPETERVRIQEVIDSTVKLRKRIERAQRMLGKASARKEGS